MSNQKHLQQIAVRSVQANQFNFDDTNLKVSGYVNETGKPSDPIPNWGETDQIPEDRDFIEVMQPGVFKDAIQNADFVDFYLEHEPSNYLSSTREGTLQLSEDSTGLKMSAQIVPTSWGKDTYTLIKNNVIKSMSFGFVPIQDQWDLQGDTPVRTVTKLQLLEVSAVRFPAYPDSSIEARRKHFKRLNHMLEKRGLTLKTIHERGVKSMVKKNATKKDTTKKEVRSGGMSSQSMGAADVNNIVSALNKNATSVDNLTNAVQEGSEVLSNIAAQIMQSANNDRSKKDVHKKSGAAKSEKRSSAVSSESSAPASSASSVASSGSSVSASSASSAVSGSTSVQSSSVESEAKSSAKPSSEDSARAKKSSEDSKKAKRAAKAVKVMKALKGLNETV